jgi:hypothetical protein
MPQFLKDYGERLVELGYTVLPIRPGTKRPDLKNWPHHATAADDVRAWYSNGRAGHGVGINARNTPAIDVDVMDREIADAMSDAIDRIFPGVALLTRTGLAPKFLIPFRSDEPFRKITSSVYTDGTNEHKVEILGDGQQWVAYHVHPDTGKPYAWWDGLGAGGIVDMEHEALPVLGREDAQRVLDAFEVLAHARMSSGQWRAVTRASEAKDRSSDADPFAEYAQPVTDLTRSQIETLIHKLDWDSRDDWVRAGRILHHQYSGGEEGFEIWNAWATNSSKWQAETEAAVWESFGRRHDAPETIRALIKDFGQPPAEEHKPAPPHPQATKEDPVPFSEGSQFAIGFEDIDWLIEDVVPRAQVGVIYGASGSGKTFFALDMACAVQRGGVWRMKHIEQADTFYVAAEAGNGIKKRIAAYLQFHGAGPMPWFVDYQPNLATLESVHAISTSIKLRSQNAGLIFLDTLSLSHDGDENSSKDMSLVLRHCKILSDDTGALVVLVHHTGKDESKGMRGSSSLYAGADFVLEVVSKDKDRTMIVDKLKDGERGAKFGFSLQSVEVGTTPRGKVITSCYVREEVKTISKAEGKPLTNEQQIFIFEVFRESLGMATEMTETELVDAVKAKQKANDNVPSQGQSIRKSIAKIVIAGHICKEGERLSLPHSGSFGVIRGHPNEGE